MRDQLVGHAIALYRRRSGPIQLGVAQCIDSIPPRVTLSTHPWMNIFPVRCGQGQARYERSDSRQRCLSIGSSAWHDFSSIFCGFSGCCDVRSYLSPMSSNATGSFANLFKALPIEHPLLVGGKVPDPDTWRGGRSLQASRTCILPLFRFRAPPTSDGIHRCPRRSKSPTFVPSASSPESLLLPWGSRDEAWEVHREGERSDGNHLDGWDEQATRNDGMTQGSCRGKVQDDRFDVGAREMETFHSMHEGTGIRKGRSERPFHPIARACPNDVRDRGNHRRSDGRRVPPSVSEP